MSERSPGGSENGRAARSARKGHRGNGPVRPGPQDPSPYPHRSQRRHLPAAQLAQIINEPLNNVSNHIRELLDGGSIEIAKTEQKGNILQHYYRAVEIPYYSQEEAEAMTFEQCQVTAGLVVQSASAEVMAALWAGKLADPRTILSWDWYNLDQEGREDLEAEQRRYLERVREIEVEATNRRAESGEETISMLVTLFGYERARKGHKVSSS